MAVSKTCSNCKRIKPLTEFHRNRAQPGGRASQCKACISRARKQKALRGKALAGTAFPAEKETKTCGNCGKRKLHKLFNRNTDEADGLNEICRTCERDVRANATRKRNASIDRTNRETAEDQTRQRSNRARRQLGLDPIKEQ